MIRISVIIPCLNEAQTIELLLENLRQQTVDLASMEVLIADGMSTDATRDRIRAYQARHPELAIRVVDNPGRIIPSALNRALAVARGEYIVRLDAHSVPERDYVQKSLADLDQGLGDIVGGVMQVKPKGPGGVARAIASAMAHPLGVGDARYRYGTTARQVDTVPFGSFRRSLCDRVGLFNENLLANEDYEFNTRLRKQGGRLWLNPEIRFLYFPRDTFRALARQYGRYGYWKWRMLQHHPGSLRWRQALPPLFVAEIVGLALLGLAFPWARWAFLAQLGLYLGVLVVGTARQAWVKRDPQLLLLVPLAIMVMHFSWGAGFNWSVLRGFLPGAGTAAGGGPPAPPGGRA